ENKRHLFPLSHLAGVWITYRSILFPVSGLSGPWILAFPTPALRIPSAPIYSDRSGGDLVACSFGRRSTFVPAISPAPPSRIAQNPGFRVHRDFGRPLHGGREIEGPGGRRVLRAGGLCLCGAESAADAASLGRRNCGNRDMAEFVSGS